LDQFDQIQANAAPANGMMVFRTSFTGAPLADAILGTVLTPPHAPAIARMTAMTRKIAVRENRAFGSTVTGMALNPD
jgi:hypothetical protein